MPNDLEFGALRAIGQSPSQLTFPSKADLPTRGWRKTFKWVLASIDLEAAWTGAFVGAVVGVLFPPSIVPMMAAEASPAD